ncbi:hypothetical protein [Microbacterium oleivorans]|uniref:hypothetical protein n=1 Tax=Microbacterium oleivorans TaxID=273677 RepID=UPI000767180A|nr:hypothetical protein [Microbacterium oleivorans]
MAIEVSGLLTSHANGPDGNPLFPNNVVAEVEFSEQRWPRTLVEPEWDERGRSIKAYCFNRPGVEWVKAMVARGYEVVWSSVWLEHVDTYFGARLGLPRFENVYDPSMAAMTSDADAHIAPLARRYPGRPILLTLDDPAPEGGGALGLARHPRDRSISMVTAFPWFATAMPEDLAEMTQWLEMTTTLEGQRELARLRQHHKRRGRDHMRAMRARVLHGEEHPWMDVGRRPTEEDRLAASSGLSADQIVTYNVITEVLRQGLGGRIDEWFVIDLLRNRDIIGAVKRSVDRAKKSAVERSDDDQQSSDD